MDTVMRALDLAIIMIHNIPNHTHGTMADGGDKQQPRQQPTDNTQNTGIMGLIQDHVHAVQTILLACCSTERGESTVPSFCSKSTSLIRNY